MTEKTTALAIRVPPKIRKMQSGADAQRCADIALTVAIDQLYACLQREWTPVIDLCINEWRRLVAVKGARVVELMA